MKEEFPGDCPWEVKKAGIQYTSKGISLRTVCSSNSHRRENRVFEHKCSQWADVEVEICEVLFWHLLFSIKCEARSSAESENWQEMQEILKKLCTALQKSEKLNGPWIGSAILFQDHKVKVTPNGFLQSCSATRVQVQNRQRVVFNHGYGFAYQI